MNIATMTDIESALRTGGKLHGFLSGGRLRVLSIAFEDRGASFYGEHPHLAEAFRILADDIRAGGRDYAAVYGPIETHYYTGSSQVDGALEAWIARGRSFDAYATPGGFSVELHGYQETKIPKAIVDRASAGETIRWRDSRGVEFVSSPARFPNGEACCSTGVFSVPEALKGDVWMWKATYRSEAQTLIGAIDAAVATVPIGAPQYTEIAGATP